MPQRILALLIKELAGLWKDRRTRFVILIPPLLQVIIFAYAATYDVKDVELGIWNEDAGAQGAEMVRRFAGSPAFRPTAMLESPAQVAAAIELEARCRRATCVTDVFRRLPGWPARSVAASDRCKTIEYGVACPRLRIGHRGDLCG